MAKTKSIPPIPPLSVAKAHEIDAIQGKLARTLEHCMDPHGQISDELKVKTYLSSYVVKIFGEFLEAYIFSPNLKLWIPELKLNSAKWVLTCIADYRGVTDEDVERYGKLLLATLDEHVKSTFSSFESSANPILTALAKPPLDTTQADRYARAGIDMASAPPLLVMAHAAAQESARRRFTNPTLTTPKRRIPRSIHSESAAKKLEDYLNAKGLSQTQFAIQINVDQKTLYRLRTTGKVGKSVAQVIAQAMGITLEEFTSR